MSSKEPAPESSPSQKAKPATAILKKILRIVLWGSGIAAAGLASLLIVLAIAMAMAFPNLPDISALSDYRPKLPLRVFTADGDLMGEFGEERRHLIPIKEIPKVMTDAVLAIEDNRFYEHGGVDYKGIARAAFANLGRLARLR